MKITAIKQQIKRTDRYSVFVEGKYAFSLSEAALLESKLANGQELSKEQLREYKKLSAEDKLYRLTLRYITLRLRSRWEIEFYLERKGASPALATAILNKLSNLGLINDEKLAQAYVNDRRLLRPTSRRKIIAELRKKHIDSEIIEQALGENPGAERSALLEIVNRKRQQPKYQDDLMLMRYLARQGFSYGDIKDALRRADEI